MLRMIGAQSHGMTTRELADALGVTMRTIQRDLAAVQAEPLRVPLWREGRRWMMLDTGRGMADY